eukprot:gene1078-1876_t
MSRNELLDQATLRGAKGHQCLRLKDLLTYCLDRQELDWKAYESESESEYGSSQGRSDEDAHGSDDSDPPPRRATKKKAKTARNNSAPPKKKKKKK